jgi:hypothetical protein
MCNTEADNCSLLALLALLADVLQASSQQVFNIPGSVPALACRII